MLAERDAEVKRGQAKQRANKGCPRESNTIFQICLFSVRSAGNSDAATGMLFLRCASCVWHLDPMRHPACGNLDLVSLDFVKRHDSGWFQTSNVSFIVIQSYFTRETQSVR